MSGWNPVLSTTPGGWGTSPIDTWSDFKPENSKALRRKHIILKRHTDALLEDYVLESTNTAPSNLKYYIPMKGIAFTYHLACITDH